MENYDDLIELARICREQELRRMAEEYARWAAQLRKALARAAC